MCHSAGWPPKWQNKARQETISARKISQNILNYSAEFNYEGALYVLVHILLYIIFSVLSFFSYPYQS